MKIPKFEEYVLLDPDQRRQIRQYQLDHGLPVYPNRKGIPNPLKGQPNYKSRGPRGPYPHVWRSGPDNVLHDQFIAWHRQRAQAHYRGEEYLLTYEEFKDIWRDHWHQRGRSVDSVIMTRQDPELPWAVYNVEIMTRRDFLRITGSRTYAKNRNLSLKQ